MKINISILTITVCVLLLLTMNAGAMTCFAAGVDTDGTYSVPVKLDGLKMGADNFSSTAILEKEGENYYMTFGHSSSISKLTLMLGDKQVGYMVSEENGWIYYTYTLSEATIKESLPFTAYINAMGRDVNFTISLDLSAASKTSDNIEDRGERPAQFVPVITTDAAKEYSLTYGSVFVIPTAAANIGSSECKVEVSVYYLNGESSDSVDIENNSFVLANIGEYRLIYKAASSDYKTNFGNDAYTEYEVIISSSATADAVAKIEDFNNVLKDGANVMAGKLNEESAFYKQAAAAMEEISDNFEVLSVNIVNRDGTQADLSGAVKLYLKADSTYDRTQVIVYHMDTDGSIKKIETTPYGRYVSVTTEKTGIFIVCVPGIEFVMPMWGYALILAGGLIIAVEVVVVSIMVSRRRNKKGA